MPDTQSTIFELRERLRAFVAERAWQKYHDAKNLAMSIAIEAAELMEHFQWVRSEELARPITDEALCAEVRDEIADVACYLLGLCNVLEIDLSDAVVQKIEKNARKYPAAEFHGRYERPRGDAR